MSLLGIALFFNQRNVAILDDSEEADSVYHFGIILTFYNKND